jgi:hypothetical protein
MIQSPAEGSLCLCDGLDVKVCKGTEGACAHAQKVSEMGVLSDIEIDTSR